MNGRQRTQGIKTAEYVPGHVLYGSQKAFGPIFAVY